MFESDGIENFSQTFSQCSLNEDILQIDSQNIDASIFDQNTPDIELLCEKNEVVNSSQKDILIGFDEGKAVTQYNEDSESESTSPTDFLKNIDSNTVKTSDDVPDNLSNENYILDIENSIFSQQNESNENESDQNESKTSNEDLPSTAEICFVNSPIFVGAEEFVNTSYEESRSSIIEEYQSIITNEARNDENSECINSNKKIKLIIKKSDIINETVKITDYIQLKKKLPNRGRPLKIKHDIPNLNRIKDPGKIKYAERRYKNNIASQNSRIKRNMKGKQIKIENEKLEQRNKELLKQRQKFHKLQERILKELKKRNIDISYDLKENCQRFINITQ